MKTALIIACSLAILGCDYKPTKPVSLTVPFHIDWGGAVYFATVEDGPQKTPWISIDFLERSGGVVVQGFDSQEECRISRSRCTWTFRATFGNKGGPDTIDNVMVTLYPDQKDFKRSKVEFSSGKGRLPNITRPFDDPDTFGHRMMAHLI